VIPDEAVEAAARCLPGYDPHWGGGEVDRAENEALRSRALQMLEAAAPHLMAEALEAAALDFELSPHNSRSKMARHFNNAYVARLRERAAKIAGATK